jgi:predicted nucleic acid-binding protein
MTADRFFDTNVVFYALSSDAERAPVAQRAVYGGGVVSVQVLNELTLACRRKLKLGWPEIDRGINALIPFFSSVTPMLLHTHLLGRDIAERYQFQFYDSLLLASALEAGCTRFVSEDMQDGMMIEGLTIENPFRR